MDLEFDVKMTHAWLIIAHNEFRILQMLISALDYPGSDFYVHIDKKVKELPHLKVNNGKIIWVKNRVDVRWGSFSQIECEYALFEEAFRSGAYDYYHVISGVHLPLQPVHEINAFFEARKGNSIMTGLCRDTPYQETLKVRRYNLFLRNYSSKKQFLRYASQFLWKTSISIQRLLGIKHNAGISFYKASNWLSLTEEAVQYMLDRKEEVGKVFRFSFCGDEFFVPTELMASPLKERVLNEEMYLLHTITRSNAGSFLLDEYDRLCKTGYLFARKFTEK